MLFTVNDAATFLGVPYYTVVNMIQKGVIPCVRQDFPRKVWLREEDLTTYKEARDKLNSLRREAQAA